MYTIVLTGSFDSRHSIVPGNDGQLRIRKSECKLFYRFVIKLCCITRPHFPFYYFESLLRHVVCTLTIFPVPSERAFIVVLLFWNEICFICYMFCVKSPASGSGHFLLPGTFLHIWQ